MYFETLALDYEFFKKVTKLKFEFGTTFILSCILESEGLWLNKISFKDEVTEMMKQLEEKGHQVTIQWLKSVFSPRRTLLVIDMQNDFITGSLPVPGAEEIVDKVEELTDSDLWYQVNFFYQKSSKGVQK